VVGGSWGVGGERPGGGAGGGGGVGSARPVAPPAVREWGGEQFAGGREGRRVGCRLALPPLVEQHAAVESQRDDRQQRHQTDRRDDNHVPFSPLRVCVHHWSALSSSWS